MDSTNDENVTLVTLSDTTITNVEKEVVPRDYNFDMEELEKLQELLTSLHLEQLVDNFFGKKKIIIKLCVYLKR